MGIFLSLSSVFSFFLANLWEVKKNNKYYCLSSTFHVSCGHQVATVSHLNLRTVQETWYSIVNSIFSYRIQYLFAICKMKKTLPKLTLFFRIINGKVFLHCQCLSSNGILYLNLIAKKKQKTYSYFSIWQRGKNVDLPTEYRHWFCWC